MSWPRACFCRSCSSLEAERDLVERDDPPEVVPLLDQDVLAAPVPGRQAVEVVAADQQHPDAALADDLADPRR